MPTKKLTPRQRALAAGYRSGLEERIANELAAKGIPVRYEKDLIRYVVPSRPARYTPDWVLQNGQVIESKGRFVTADRQKMILMKKQHPLIDIRFVFSNPNTRISKKSQTTYGDWCDKHGYKYAKGSIPDAWINEATNHDSHL